MNILMIRNGFDLEHDLPTSYPEFLKFVANFHKAYKVANDIPKRLDDIRYNHLLVEIQMNEYFEMEAERLEKYYEQE